MSLFQNKEKIKELKKQQIQKKKEKKIYNTILHEELTKPIDDLNILKATVSFREEFICKTIDTLLSLSIWLVNIV